MVLGVAVVPRVVTVTQEIPIVKVVRVMDIRMKWVKIMKIIRRENRKTLSRRRGILSMNMGLLMLIQKTQRKSIPMEDSARSKMSYRARKKGITSLIKIRKARI